MIIDIINKLDQNGYMKFLCEAGLLAPKIFLYRDLYNLVEIQKKLYAEEHKDAVRIVANKIRVSRVTVYKAIKIMTIPTQETDAKELNQLVA